MLSSQETADLTARCLHAHTYGYLIANAADYAQKLGYTGSKPAKVKEFSPAHLLHLLGNAHMLAPQKVAVEKAGVLPEPAKTKAPKSVKAPKVEEEAPAISVSESDSDDPTT